MEGDLNPGHAVLNAAPCPPEATIAVTGMGRSGTTMVARVLNAVGLPLGPSVDPQRLEDPAILAMIKADRIADLAALCRDRDRQHPKWAFKCPALRSKLAEVHPHLRAGRYIVPFRDIMAVAQRNSLSVGTDLREGLRLAASGYMKLQAALGSLDAPILVMSYEKALQHPGAAVAAIAAFCGVSLARDEADRIAAATIRNSDPAYLGTAPAARTG